MRDYASLQLLLDEQGEGVRERLIYGITAHMDSIGCMPCGRESAERVVRFARVSGGWAVFDDCADRLDVGALSGLACCLSRFLHTRAVGIMGSRGGLLMRLYQDGRLKDTFVSSSRMLPPRRSFKRFFRKDIACGKHALYWRPLLCNSSVAALRELTDAFAGARQDPAEGFDPLRRLLGLDESAAYGFASVDDSPLQDVITLYFCAANHVRQRWFDRVLRLPARCGSATGVLFRRQR